MITIVRVIHHQRLYTRLKYAPWPHVVMSEVFRTKKNISGAKLGNDSRSILYRLSTYPKPGYMHKYVSRVWIYDHSNFTASNAGITTNMQIYKDTFSLAHVYMQ